MPVLFPDTFTAWVMTGAVACLLAWALRMLGHAYWRKGLSLAAASTASYGVGYACAALSTQQPETLWRLLQALAFNFAIAALTLAIERFRDRQHTRRALAIVLLPMAATLLLSAARLSVPTPWQQAFQSSIFAVQALFVMALLVHLRSQTPGSGWQWLTAAIAVQCAVHGMSIAHSFSPELGVWQQATAQWLLQLLPMVHLMVCSMGFLVMLRDRETSLEWRQAQLDPLTQLPNRAALVQHLRTTIEQSAQQQQPLAILVLDIDHFKSVNDSYGHLVGDQVIQSVASTLLRQSRSSDFSARYGGEEFVVVLPNTPAREAFRIADLLCQTVRKSPIPLPNGKPLYATISIGVYAGHPTHGSSWERWVSAADEAMYRAKNNGRDRVFMSGPVQAMQSDAVTAEVEHC